MRGGPRLASRLLIAALVLHGLEEAVGFRWRHEAIARRLPLLPPVETFWAALAAVTLAGVLLLLWAGSEPSRDGKRLALRAVAWILLVNVLVPHVPAAVVLGGYAPGVVTAVLVNLPVALLALRWTR